VPQLARARSLTRQHVQALVNGLAAQGYVELVENPAHKRSRLVCLTPRGSGLVRRIRRREEGVLARLEIPLSAGELQAAAGVVRAVRVALERGGRQGLFQAAEEAAAG
jgi:DNA-binding MarR family transcriptional regulator